MISFKYEFNFGKIGMGTQSFCTAPKDEQIQGTGCRIVLKTRPRSRRKTIAKQVVIALPFGEMGIETPLLLQF
jgi:hypothetical protein